MHLCVFGKCACGEYSYDGVFQSGAQKMMVSKEIHGQSSFVLENDVVSLAITKQGGHMAPVVFGAANEQQIRPYYVSPWQEEDRSDMPAEVLVPLRGDFFCLPFGGNAQPYQNQNHPVHGETATAEWTFVDSEEVESGISRLRLVLDTRVRKGRVTKEITLRDRHPVIYQRHCVEGFVGPSPVGHHAILEMPDEEGTFVISTSPFRLGMTNPGVFGDPAAGEYQMLAEGKSFCDLREIPTLFRDPAVVDCSRLPLRRGFTDLFAVVADAESLAGKPAWTAAVNTSENWAWFSLRDPRKLPMTAFWLENHGRHSFPWNGRNQCLGVEDICGYFAEGIAASARANLLTEQGIATAIDCTEDSPLDIRSIQAAVPVPVGFNRVEHIDFRDKCLRLISDSGSSVEVTVDHSFVLGDENCR
tara:strand:- start:25 stop:1272 length:1248 start_codon:yes stop_codon:yes gene_type:complete